MAKREKFSKKDFESCHVENLKYLDFFLRDEENVERFKEVTLKNYEYYIRHFMTWNNLYNGNEEFYRLDGGDFLEYLRYCYKQDYARSSIKNRQNVLILFFDWFITKHKHRSPFFINIAVDINPIRVKDSYRLGLLSGEEIVRIKEFCKKRNKLMELLVLVLIVDYGMYFREVGQLTRKSVDFNISETGKYLLNEVTDMNGNIKRYMVDEKVMEAMREYLIERGDDEFNSLFVHETKEGRIPLLMENAINLTLSYSRMLGRAVNQSDLHRTHEYLKNLRSVKLREKMDKKRKEARSKIKRRGKR